MRTRRHARHLVLVGALLAVGAGCDQPESALPEPDGPARIHWEMETPPVEPAELMLIRRSDEPTGGPGHVLLEMLALGGFTQRQVHVALERLGNEELARDDVVAARIIVFGAVADRPYEARLVPIAYAEAAPLTGWGAPPGRATPTRLQVHFGAEPPW